MQLFVELLAAGVMSGAKLGISALGFALLFYTTRELHFAFGAVAVASAYVLFWVVQGIGDGPLAIAIAVIAAFAAAVLFSVALHKWIYLRLNSVLPVVMASLGIGLVVENAIQIVAGPGTQILSFPSLNRLFEVGFLRFRMLDVYVLIVFVVVAIGIDLFLNRSKLGQGLSATMDDAEMAELVGVRTSRMRVGAYSAGAALGTLSSIVMLVDTGVKPANGFLVLLFALIITILGRGSLRAIAIWSVLFGIVRGLWSWKFSTEYQELAMFALMLAYLILRDALDRYRANRIIRPGAGRQEARA